MNTKNGLDITPFIQILDIFEMKQKYTDSMKEKLQEMINHLEEKGTSQIILKNWSKVAEEDFFMAYAFIKRVCIKFSLMLEPFQRVEQLDKIVCNIYKVYQNDFTRAGDKVKQYFLHRGVRIWAMVDLRNQGDINLELISKEYGPILKEENFEKIVFRIKESVESKEVFGDIINSYKQEEKFDSKVIICPQVCSEHHFILDIGEITISE